MRWNLYQNQSGIQRFRNTWWSKISYRSRLKMERKYVSFHDVLCCEIKLFYSRYCRCDVRSLDISYFIFPIFPIACISFSFRENKLSVQSELHSSAYRWIAFMLTNAEKVRMRMQIFTIYSWRKYIWKGSKKSFVLWRY